MTRLERRVLTGMAWVGLILAALVVFFYRPTRVDDLLPRLTNADTPTNRLIYRVGTSDGTVYWVLTRGHRQ